MARKAVQWVAILSLMALPFALNGFAQTPVVLDEIVAKVNNEIITLTDLEKELNYLRTALREEIKDPVELEKEFQERKKEVLRRMIEDKMMLQKAEEVGLTANIDVEVAAMLEETRKQAGIPNMQVFEQVLQQRGTSMAEYRANVKKRMILDELVRQFVYSKITLLTSEIEAFYKENVDRFTEPAEVELAEILFLTEGKDKAQVRQKAEELLARVKAGTPFEEAAKTYSEGPTASKGGQIGSFKKGSMAPALEEAAFSLGEGEMSGIVETDYGLQIVKVVARKAPRQKPLEEIRPQIQQYLYQKKAQPEMLEFMEDLREQSYVYVAPKYKEEFDVTGLT